MSRNTGPLTARCCGATRAPCAKPVSRDYLLSRSVVGTPEQCVEQLNAAAGAGVEKVWLHMLGYYDPEYAAYLTTVWNDVLSELR